MRLLTSFALVMVGAITLFAQEKDANTYFRQGWGQYRNGNYKEAIVSLTEAIKRDTGHFEAYCWRARAKVDAGDYKSAVADFDEAIKLKSDYASAYAERGSARKQLNDTKGAEEDFKKAGELDKFYKEITEPSKNAKETVGKKPKEFEDTITRLAREAENTAKSVRPGDVADEKFIHFVKELCELFIPLKADKKGAHLASELKASSDKLKSNKVMDAKLVEILEEVAHHMRKEQEAMAYGNRDRALLQQAFILLAKLEDKDVEVRRSSADTLADFIPRLRGKAVDEALRAVESAHQREKDTVTRIHLRGAIDELNRTKQIEKYIDLLLSKLENKKWSWAEYTVDGNNDLLTEVRNSGVVKYLDGEALGRAVRSIYAKLDNSDPVVRMNAVEWLGEIAESQLKEDALREAVKAIVAKVEDQGEYSTREFGAPGGAHTVRWHAINALRGGPTIFNPSRKRLIDRIDKELKTEAIQVLEAALKREGDSVVSYDLSALVKELKE